MPIRVDQKRFYPIDWRELSRVIRFDRAQGRCERCARPHGQWVTRDANGRWWDETRQRWRDGRGRVAREDLAIRPAIVIELESPVSQAADVELMEVAVSPDKASLQGSVELGEVEIAGQFERARHRRLNFDDMARMMKSSDSIIGAIVSRDSRGDNRQRHFAVSTAQRR